MLFEVYSLMKYIEICFLSKIIHLWMMHIDRIRQSSESILFVLPFILRYALKKFVCIHLKNRNERGFVMAMSHNFLINLGFEKVNESHLGHPFSTEDDALNYL